MGEATVLGSLLIQLGMDSAQFERATARAQSSVQKMAQNIGAQAKDVVDASNRMGISITSFSTQVQTLQARLNPGVQALANYRKEVTLLKEAYRIGAITQTQFTTSLRTAVQGYRTGGTQIVVSSGAMKAGMQQLNYQIGDMATMWAMGAKPQQIFASQAEQTVQAISLMTGGAGKFATFMGGPWGIAIQAGVIVLSSIIPTLMKTEDAMQDVELASNGLADAQSALGDMFDLTTGKLKNQNEMLRLNAQLMAINLRAQASQEKANSDRTFSNFKTGQLGLSTGQKVLGSLGVPVGGAMSRLDDVRSLYSDFQAGKLSSGAAAKKAEGLDFSGLAVTKQEFMQAIADGVSYPGKEKIADAIEKSLKDGVLDPSLRDDPKSKKPPKKKAGKTEAQLDDEYADAMGRLNSERLNLEAQYTQSIEAKHKATLADIDEDLAAYKRNVELNKNLTPQRKQALITAAEANAQTRRDMADTEKQQAIDAQTYDLKIADLNIQMDQLNLRRQLALSTKDQRDADLAMLDLQDRLKEAQLDRILATEAIGSAAWSNAFSEKQALKATAGQRRELVERQTASPLQSYKLGLQSSVANINDAMENIQVNGIEGLTNGLANAVAGTEKLGDVFKNVAQQIIADLARIAIQKAIVGSLGNLLGGGSLFGGGGSSALSGFSFESSWFNDPTATVNLAGARAAGGPVHMGLPYLVGERGPEIVVPGQSGQVVPNHELAALGGGGGITNNYYGPGAEEFWGQVNGVAANNANQAVVTNKQRDTRRAARKLGRS